MRTGGRLLAAVLLLVGPACVAEPPAQTSPNAGRPAAAAEPAASPTPIASCRARPKRDLDPSVADAHWAKRIEALARDHRLGVAVGLGTDLVYSHDARRARVPASNQKLLLSFALFERLGPHYRVPTSAAAATVENGTVLGDLWILGRGDPTLTAHEPGYWGDIEATTLARLAETIKRSGIKKVNGRIMAAVDFFAHDLDAPGWQPYVPHQYVQSLSSLVLSGNNAYGKPERAVAAALKRELKRVGVSVSGASGSGKPPETVDRIALVRSRPLAEIVAYMNRTSNNFFAEMLGKLLGAELFDPPGTIEKGARAIAAWTSAQGVKAVAHDSSGLSYKNRVSPEAIVELLGLVETRSWGKILRDGLPGPNEGTLRYRLPGLEVHAKTGTLFNGASALSGWVRSTKGGRWVAFSILDRHAPKAIEDRIVRIISKARIRVPSPDESEACATRP
jgi:D-alanyl-D-alanine carboxypeptidase/D-alanyl-D-alanine-endopeptidase (penicillin-binding protein 4)